MRIILLLIFFGKILNLYVVADVVCTITGNNQQSCSPIHLTSIDTDDGACTNSTDKSIVNHQNRTAKAIGECGKECFITSDLEHCVSDCAVSSLNISNECASCFGVQATCTKKNCMLNCLDPTSAGCKVCSLHYCGAALESCTGIPLNSSEYESCEQEELIPEVENHGACTDSSDESIISNETILSSALMACGVECVVSFNPQRCVTNCAKSKLALSNDCAGCYGLAAVCTKRHCMIKCLNPRSEGCKQCSITNCGHALDTCTGVPQ